MSFFDIKFNKLFLEKHGNPVYNDICNKIKFENNTDYSEKYVEAIFDIAFLELWGMNNNQLIAFINDICKIDNLDIQEFKLVHKDSITKIQQYIKIVIGDNNTNIK